MKSKVKVLAKELRRSAVEDKDPKYDCSISAFYTATHFGLCYGGTDEEIRLFFLLVAEALEGKL